MTRAIASALMSAVLVTVIPACDPPPATPKPTPEGGVPPAIPKPPPEGESLTVLTVGEVIKALKLDEAKMQYSCEPPGKLRELIWYETKLLDTDAVVSVTIEIIYTLDVFSTTGTWDITKVRAARVQEVTVKGREP